MKRKIHKRTTTILFLPLAMSQTVACPLMRHSIALFEVTLEQVSLDAFCVYRMLIFPGSTDGRGLSKRTASAQSIIVRSTDVNRIDELDNEIVSGRGRAVLDDSVYFLKAGIEAIVEDSVTCRFEAERLACWNMMTRTSHIWCEFISWKLNLLYYLGFLFRYGFLLPVRAIIFFIGLIFLSMSTAVLGLLPDGSLKRDLNEKCMLTSFRILSRCLTAVIYFHDEHNKAKNGGMLMLSDLKSNVIF